MGGVKCLSLRPEKERENICFFYTAHSLLFHLFSNQENGTFQGTTEGSIIIHFLQHESLHLLPSVFSLDFSFFNKTLFFVLSSAGKRLCANGTKLDFGRVTYYPFFDALFKTCKQAFVPLP